MRDIDLTIRPGCGHADSNASSSDILGSIAAAAALDCQLDGHVDKGMGVPVAL